MLETTKDWAYLWVVSTKVKSDSNLDDYQILQQTLTMLQFQKLLTLQRSVQILLMREVERALAFSSHTE